MAELILDKVGFRAKKITRGGRHYMTMIKGSVHKENITVLNVHASNNRAAKYVKQKLLELKREISQSIILIRNFSTPLSVIDIAQLDRKSARI